MTIDFCAFSDEMTKIAGFELGLVGYPKDTSSKLRRIAQIKNRLRHKDDEKLEDEQDDLEGEVRWKDPIKTPYDREAGAKMTTWEVLRAAGKEKKWDALSTHEGISDKDQSVPLSMARLRNLKRDYQAGLQNTARYTGSGRYKDIPLKPGQVLPHEKAFIKQVDHLVKNPQVSFARLEYH